MDLKIERHISKKARSIIGEMSNKYILIFTTEKYEENGLFEVINYDTTASTWDAVGLLETVKHRLLNERNDDVLLADD